MKKNLLFFSLVLLAMLVNGQQVVTTWLDYELRQTTEANAACRKVVTLSGDSATTIHMYWFATKHESIEHYKNGFPTGRWQHLVNGKLQREYDFSKVTYLTESELKERGRPTDTTGLIPPSYAGGTEGWLKFIQKNLKYPHIAFVNGFEGSTQISFIIKPDGTAVSLAIVKGSNPYLDYEAFRVIRLMKKWHPATKHGTPIDFSVTLPVKFSLAEKEKPFLEGWGIFM